MGLFSKIKNMFKGSQEEVEEEKREEQLEKKVEDDGLNPLAIDQEEPKEETIEKKKEVVKDSVKVY